jgi:hypothetical protein
LERADGLKVHDGKFYLSDVVYAALIFSHPSSPQGRFYPRNAEELFNLRHYSRRVRVERAFTTLKNTFKILDQKHFHTFSTHIKLVLACCIFHNWILGLGIDAFFPEEYEVMPDDIDAGHGVAANNNAN